MNLEQNTQSPYQQEQPDYSLPPDQGVFERNLLHRYAAYFPDSAPLMEQAVSVVHDYAKLGTAEGAREAGSDEDRSHGYKYLSLREPTEYQFEELGVLTSPHERVYREDKDKDNIGYEKFHPRHMAEQNIARSMEASIEDGTKVIGDVPQETSVMLEELYRLTGSSIIRDDRETGQKIGMVIRQGSYKGSPVYFIEDYTDNSDGYRGKTTLRMRVVGEETAKNLKAQATPSETHELLSLEERARGPEKHMMVHMPMPRRRENAAVLQLAQPAGSVLPSRVDAHNSGERSGPKHRQSRSSRSIGQLLTRRSLVGAGRHR